MFARGASVIVLGCTHYPLLRAVIEREAEALAGSPVRIVDSAHATAEALPQFLASRDGAADSRQRGDSSSW